MPSSYVSKVRIENYKCYREAVATLAPGINVVIGKNNAGKSALLEVLAFACDSSSKPAGGSDTAQIDYELTVADRPLFEKQAGFRDLPLPNRAFLRDRGLKNDQAFLDWIFAQDVVRFQGTFDARTNKWISKPPTIRQYPFELVAPGQIAWLDWNRDPAGYPVAKGSSAVSPPNTDMGLRELENLRKLTYLFRPDRIAPGASPLSTDGTLSQDASNLAGVLQHLEGESKLDEYIELVGQVFPEIQNITVRAASAQNVSAYLWPVRGEPARAVRVEDSGRGVAPVLAILYLLYFEKQRECRIIIDEPQAFLHPSALRRFLSVLGQHGHHQFVLATHSPAVLSATAVEQCLVVRQIDGISTIEAVGTAAISDARSILDEVGASLRDVWGAESIIWVEGPTEVYCFGQLISADPNLQVKGSAILPLRSTGDFNKKHTTLVVEIYNRLTTSNAMIPPAIAFQFDREDRTEQEIRELDRQFNSTAFFTHRKMYENYLLRPEGIAALINQIDPSRAEPATAADVEAELQGFMAGKPGESWIETAHGAKVLESIIGLMTEHRCDYRKTTHGPILTRWLLDNAPEELTELKHLLAQMLSRIP